MKKTMKKAFAFFLTVVMIVTTMSVGFFGITAIAATNATVSGDHQAVIAVPETVYMTPSTDASTTGQYYVNNTISGGNTYTVVPEVSANNTKGYVQFYIPGAKSFTISVNTVTSGIGDIVLAETGATSGSYENQVFNANADGSFAYNQIGFYISGTGITAGNTALAEWVFTVTMNDGSTRVYYAYSTLYSPWYQPVGAAARAKSSYHNTFASSILWVSGVHGYSDGDSNNRWYVQTANFLPMIATPKAPNNNNPDTNWIQSGSNGLSQTVNYTNNDAANKYHARSNSISPTANITVDTSRYNNFNQIPNFTVGFMITDTENGNKGSWYVSNYGTSNGSSYSNSTDNGSSQFTGHYDDAGTKFAENGSDNGSGIKVNGAWNNAVANGNYRIKSAMKGMTDKVIDTTAWNNNFVNISVTGVNKADLRSLVLQGSTLNASNYTTDSWSNYQTKLRAAAAALGNPTTGPIATTELVAARNALQTVVTFNAKSGTINGNATATVNVTVGDAATATTDLSSYVPVRDGFEFMGWSTTDGATSGEKSSITTGLKPTLYATWKEAITKYTVKFVNWDGTVLQEAEYEKGKTPVYSGNTPTKAEDAQYTYSFSGWSPAIAAVTGNTTYTAQFTNTTKQYTITFKNHDGTTLQSNKVNYGAMPSYTGSTPTKTGTAEYSYTWKGWDSEIVKVTGDATYTATFTEAKNKYTVTWKNYDGTELQKAEYEYGATPSYTGATPTKPATDEFTYTHSGWTPAVDKVTGNVTYTATFSEAKNKYTVIFKDFDGTVLQETDYEYGATPSYTGEKTPSRPADAQFTYSHTGWSPAIAAVTENAEYTAKFTGTVNKYTITWLDDEGDVLKTDKNVAYGATPSYGSTPPVKVDATGEYTYTFVKWTPEVATVTGDATYTAVFTSEKNSYTVTWKFADGTQNAVTDLYGTAITAPANSTKAPDAENHYTYTWSPAVSATITKNVTYTEQLSTAAHEWSDWNQTQAPTCTEEGTKERSCNVCGYIEYGTVDKLPHEAAASVEENRNEATCTATGSYDSVIKCKDCGEELARTTITIPAKGHTDGAVVVEKEIAPTCTVNGSYDNVTYCTVCNAQTSRETITVDALGHDYDAVVTDPTCTEDGYTTYTCKRGDHTYTADTVPATGHTEGEAVAEDVVDATCTKPGSYNSVVYCTVCGEKLSSTPVATDVIPHTDSEVKKENNKLPTCTQDGSYDNVTYCTVCNVETSRVNVTVPATGHTWSTWTETKAPTCTATGTEKRTCSECDATEEQDKAALGHNFAAEWTTDVEPTCTEDGSESRHCSRCDATTDEKAISAKGHTEEAVKGYDATCTEDGLTDGTKCSVCQEILVKQEVIEALGHDYDAVVTKPTCTEDGYTTYTCKRGDHTYTADTVPATGHKEEAVKGYAATCTENGLTDGIKCSVCNVTLKAQETIPATGHKEVIVPAVAPTCTATGLTEGKKCETCGEVTLAQKEVAAKGHTEETVKGYDATCTEDGLTDGIKCSVCKETLKAQETIPAKGHTEETITGKAATCTAAGLTDGIKCSVCGETLVKQTIIPALGHTEETVKGYAATCTEDGLTDGIKCSVCKETLKAQETIPAKGHTDGAVVVEKETAPTCTADGSYDNVTYCTVCNAQTSRETITVDALGHDYDAVVTDPTCTEDGYTTYTCKRGDHTYTADETSALGHTDGAVVVEKETAPTCTADGSYDNVTYCTVCNAQTSRETITVDALGHDYDAVVTDPTCTEDGYTTYTCKRGDHTYTADTVPATGHTEAEAVRENEIHATCGDDGSYDEVVYCSVCKAELSRESKVDPSTGYHNYANEKERVEATCTVDGYVIMACGCNKADEKTVLPKTGHTYTTEVTAPTCTEDGYTTYTCTRGDHTYTADVVPATGHDYATVVTAPTCTEDGYTTYTCASCGDEYIDDYVDALGHNYDAAVTAPTCTEDGYTTYTCTRGDHTYTSDVVPATGHDYAAVVTPPTCTEDGYTTYTCANCGDVYTADATPATGHTEETVKGYAATCTTDGLTDGVICSVCGETLTAQETIPAKGHTEETIPAVNPDCENTGLTAGKKCSVCDEILVAQTVVDALGHTETTMPAKAPTCTATGLTAGTKCAICDKVLVAQETIPATGHTEEAVKGYAATCTETGLTDGVKCSVCGETLTAQETIPAKGHTEYDLEAKAPTCTETGLTAGKKCSVCNTVTVAQTVVAATGHNYSADVTPPTCTEDGYTTYTCANCGDVYTADATPATGHTEETVKGYAATCTTDGLTDGIKCSVCGETLTAQETIPAFGHTEEAIPAKAPTCTETGLTAGVMCSVCKEILTAQEIVPANGHKEAEAVTENYVAATCKKTGSYDSVVYCSVCKVELTRETITVDKLPHTPGEEQTENNKAPTCTADGSYDKVVYCTACNAEISRETVVVPATGHTYNAVVTKPTCTEGGYTTYTCIKGDHTYTADETPATGHTDGAVVIEKETAPTCTADGSYDNVTYCTVCKAETSRETVVVPATGHTNADAVIENNVAPKCEEDGSYDSVVYCTACKEEVSRETITVAATGHTDAEAVIENNVAPKCEEDGSYDTVVYCSVCKKELSRETTTVAATGHTEAEAVRENEHIGNCQETGYYDSVVYCSVCDAELSRETITVEAGEHTPGAVLTENKVDATCLKEGSYDNVVYCSVCKNEISRETIKVEKLKHTKGTPVVENEIAPSCSVPGFYDSVVYCTVCTSEISRDTIVVPTTEHTKGTAVKENVVAPGCKTPGSYDSVIYCSVCNAEISRSIIPVSSNGHTIVIDKAIEPTCEKTGKTVGSHCSVCGEVIIAQTVVPAAGHTIIADHAVMPTCTRDGLSDGSHCSKCDLVVEEQEKIPALGHTDEDGDGICDIDGRDVTDMDPNYGIEVGPDGENGIHSEKYCYSCGREHTNFFSEIICLIIKILKIFGYKVK